MKRLFTIVLMLTVSAGIALSQTDASAQTGNTTRIGSEHRIDFGGYAGYGSDFLAHYAGIFVDINSRTSNLRTRVHFGDMQRWFNPYVAVEEQYLIPIVGGLYFYPSAGVYSELHLTVDNAEHKVAPAAQAGIGLEYQINDRCGLFAEYDAQLLYGAPSRLKGQFGISFAF